MARSLTPVWIAGLAVLALAVILTCAGTALPWLTEVESLPIPAGSHRSEPVYTQLGLQAGNGWVVLVAGILLAACLALLAALRRPGLLWIVIVPVALGGLAIGDWLAALGGTEGFPLGLGVSLLGLLLVTPAGALLRAGRPAAR
ncbi:MAG: hypothetical protein ACREQM_02130, partial [Candidatus Dormibacteraceae bacterium]